MSLVDRTRARAQAVLDPDETLQAAFAAQTWQPTWAAGIFFTFGVETAVIKTLIKKPLRVVVVTDRRYIICLAGPLSRSKIRRVLEEAPRTRPLAQPHEGTWWTCQSFGKQMWVHKRFFDEVRTADRLRPAPGKKAPQQ
jgi:hypothetical protein